MLISSSAAIKWALQSMNLFTDRERTTQFQYVCTLDCVTTTLAVKPSVARKSAGSQSFLFHILEVQVNFNISLDITASQADVSCRTAITCPRCCVPVFPPLP